MAETKKAKAIIETKYFKPLPSGDDSTTINTLVFLSEDLFDAKWNEIIKNCLPTIKNDSYNFTMSGSLIVSTMDTKYYYSKHSYEAIIVDLIV